MKHGHFGLAVAVVLLALTSAVQAGANLTINAGTRYQTFTAWEATDWINNPDTTNRSIWAPKVVDMAVNGLNINRIRLEVRPGIENPIDYWQMYRYGVANPNDPRARLPDGTFVDDNVRKAHLNDTINDNSDPNTIAWTDAQGKALWHFSQTDDAVNKCVIPMQQAWAARGGKLLVNLNYQNFKGSDAPGINYIHANAQEYAEFIQASYQHLQSTFGFAPDYYEAMLEPDGNTNWTTKYTQLGNAIVAASARLRDNGFTPRVIAPSVKNPGLCTAYVDGMKAVAGFNEAGLAEVSYHRYSTPTVAQLNGIVTDATSLGTGTAMLEMIGADYTMLHQDLKVGNVISWQQYTLAGYFNIDENAGSVSYTPQVKYLYQYMHYILPGAQRFDVQSDNGTFDPIGFINPDGRYVVVVMATGLGTFSVNGLPAGRYEISYTIGSGPTVVSQFDVTNYYVLGAGQTLNANMPGKGVMTISAVPEPASVAVLALGALTLLGRRR